MSSPRLSDAPSTPSHPDELDYLFFARNSDAPTPPSEEWEADPAPLPEGSRRAMFATLAMVMVSAIVFPAVYVYNHWVMPEPALLAGTGPSLPGSAAFQENPGDAWTDQLLASAPPAGLTGPHSTYVRPHAAVQSQDTHQRDLPSHGLVNSPPPSAADPTPGQQLFTSRTAADPGSTAGAPALPSPHVPGSAPTAERLSAAYNLLNEGRYADAVKYATELTQDAPALAEGWLVLGAAQDALGQRTEAQQAYQRCSEQQGPHAANCSLLLDL